MTTWLLTWNPRFSRWYDMGEDLLTILQGGKVPTRWSTGHTKSVQPGDQVFFLRQGMKPTGLFARGIAVRGCYQERHWRDKSRMANYALFEVQEMVSPESPFVLEVATLKEVLPSGCWQPLASGVRVSEDLCGSLETLWGAFYRGCPRRGQPPVIEDGLDGEGDPAAGESRIARLRVFSVEATFDWGRGWSSGDQRVTEMLRHLWDNNRSGASSYDPFDEEVRRVAQLAGAEILHIDPEVPLADGEIP